MGLMIDMLVRTFGTAWVSLLLLGCSHRAPVSEISISPAFSAEHIEGFIEASEEWFALVPEVRVPVVVADTGGPGQISPRVNDDCAHIRGVTSLEKGTIELCENGSPAQFKVSSKHELGHLLSGRSDHLDAGHIMSFSYSRDVRKLTAADVDYMRAP